MAHESGRPCLLPEARPLNRSHAVANDVRIVDAPKRSARPLPPELLELADCIANCIVAKIRAGGQR